MSDKAIAALYNSTGTGTGSGATTSTDLTGTKTGVTPVPASEQQVVESKQALTNLLIGAGLTIVTALGAFLQAVAPQLVTVILGSLPQIPFMSAGLVSAIILGFATWMQRKGAEKHKVAVVKALVTEPSANLKALYKTERKEEKASKA